MQGKRFIIVGSTLIVTIFFVLAFITFSILGITSSSRTDYELTIVTESDEKAYDGTPLSNDEWHLKSGKLDEGHTMDVVMPSSITTPGSIDNEIGVTILDEDGNVVTSRYAIEYDLGTLSVQPRNLTIRTESLSKTYDSTPLESDGWYIQRGRIMEDHYYEYDMPSSITNPGTIDNEIGFTIFDASDQDITDHYAITFDLGTLSVMERDLGIQTDSARKTYDGSPLSAPNWDMLSGSLLDGHTIEYEMDSSLSEAGSVDNDIRMVIRDADGNDVSDRYAIDYDLGTLDVDPIDLTVATDSASQSYDGSTLSLEAWELVHGELLEGHVMEYAMPASITSPGSIDNDIHITIFDEEDRDVTDQYAIEYDIGTLTVYHIPLIIKSGSANKVYDGTPLSNNEWELIEDNLLDGHHLNVIVDNEITDVGRIANQMFVYIKDDDDNNVTDYYDIEYFEGTLEIFSSVYSSSGIERESGEIPDQDLFKFHSQQSEPIYFRGNAFGNYDKQGWGPAFEHDLSIDTNPLSFTALALQEAGNDDFLVQIEYLREQLPYLVPYYNIDPISGTNDVFVTGDQSDIVEFNFIPEYNNDVFQFSLEDTPYENDEQIYRDFVYDHYLDVPESTYEAMLDLAYENDLDPTSRSIIFDVQQYIQNAATYNLNYETIPDDVDIAVYFLTESQEGICQHYATAAALMYRSLGIPARYVTGFLGLGEADEWTTVNHEYGHAWVEVYIDGLGWVPVEVTGSLPSEDLEPGDGIGGGLEPGEGENGDGEDGDGENGDGENGDGENGDGENGDGENGDGENGDGENGEIPEQDLFKFHSPQSAPIYFRGSSFGSYNKQGWDTAFEHDLDIDTNPLSFTALALQEAGNDDFLVQIEYLWSQLPYMVPYYSIDPISGTNDVYVSGDTSGIVEFNFIPEYNGDMSQFSLEGTPYAYDEQIYRDFVYDHYLDIPESTYAAMLDLADQNGLDPSSDSIIYDVQQYIQNAATYNLDYEPLPEGEDKAIYFLTESQEGLCRHYATAATLMYRSLGIPARYVTGFMGLGEADEWTTVNHEYAHAWVEVYIDGLGWVPVEVTGSLPAEDLEPGDGVGGGFEPGDEDEDNGEEDNGEDDDENGDEDEEDDENGDEDGDDDNGDPDDGEETLGSVRVRPEHIREAYESGKTITADGAVVTRFGPFAQQGYTYDVEVEGTLSDPGKATSTITAFTIYDPDGNDVTDQFEIVFGEGVLQLYKYSVELSTSSVEGTYDGTPLTGDAWDITDTLEDGHVVDHVVFTGRQTDVGTSMNRAIITIHDEHGEDVTDLYLVTNAFGQLSVTPREITIASQSDEKAFDGEALTNDEYEIIEGTLAEGETVEIEITGSQTTIGKSVNTVRSIRIYDEQDQDVTDNYSINIIEGELVVRPS